MENIVNKILYSKGDKTVPDYTKEIERKSFYIKDLERKIEKLRNQTEEEILDSYLRENHITYESWEVLEQ